MVPQEVQTLSALLKGRTGLIGTFPENRPTKTAFGLEDGTSLRLLGFNACHSSIVNKLGQKKVAGFATGRGRRRLSEEEWENLTGSANAVLFTRKGRGYAVEILKRVATLNSRDGEGLTVRFKRTGETDEFIPCG